MSKVEIIIHQDGQVDLNLSDFDGNSCLDATRTIERLLGNQITDRLFLSDQLSETITTRRKSSENIN